MYGSNGVVLGELLMLVSIRYLDTLAEKEDFEQNSSNLSGTSSCSPKFLSTFAKFTTEKYAVARLRKELLQNRLIKIDNISRDSSPSSDEIWIATDHRDQLPSFNGYRLITIHFRDIVCDLLNIFAVLPEVKNFAVQSRRAECFHEHVKTLCRLVQKRISPKEYYERWDQASKLRYINMVLDALVHRCEPSDKPLLDHLQTLMDRSSEYLDPKRYPTVFIKLKWARMKQVLSQPNELPAGLGQNLEETLAQVPQDDLMHSYTGIEAQSLTGLMLADLMADIKAASALASIATLTADTTSLQNPEKIPVSNALYLNEELQKFTKESLSWCDLHGESTILSIKAVLCRLLPQLGRPERLKRIPKSLKLDCGVHLSRAGFPVAGEIFLQQGLNRTDQYLVSNLWRYHVEFLTILMRLGRWKEADEYHIKQIKNYQEKRKSKGVDSNVDTSDNLDEFKLALDLLKADMLLNVGDFKGAQQKIMPQLSRVESSRDCFVRSKRISMRYRLIKILFGLNDLHEASNFCLQQADDAALLGHSLHDRNMAIWVVQDLFTSADELIGHQCYDKAIDLMSKMLQSSFKPNTALPTWLERDIRHRRDNVTCNTRVKVWPKKEDQPIGISSPEKIDSDTVSQATLSSVSFSLKGFEIGAIMPDTIRRPSRQNTSAKNELHVTVRMLADSTSSRSSTLVSSKTEVDSLDRTIVPKPSKMQKLVLEVEKFEETLLRDHLGPQRQRGHTNHITSIFNLKKSFPSGQGQDNSNSKVEAFAEEFLASTRFLDRSQGDLFNLAFDDWVKFLKSEVQLAHVQPKDKPARMDRSCDWIYDREKFKSWLNLPSSGTLIIEGGPGVGKSTLSYSIMEHLEEINNPIDITTGDESATPKLPETDVEAERLRPPQSLSLSGVQKVQQDPNNLTGCIVLSFMSGLVGRQISPEIILKHLIRQLLEDLLEHEPSSIQGLARKYRDPFSARSSHPVDLYWRIFEDMCDQTKRTIYCILDGMDEILNKSDPKPRISDGKDITRFIKQVCQLPNNQRNRLEDPRIKILVTTRSTAAIDFPENLVYRIQDKDVSQGVEQLIRKEMSELATIRDVSLDSVEETTQKIIKQSGPLYQWARTFLDLIKQSETTPGMLDGYDEVYKEVLKRVREEDRKIVGKILRWTYYAVDDLDLSSLQLALAIEPDDSSIVNFNKRILLDLPGFVESRCGMLVHFEPSQDAADLTTPVLRFRHQSVRDFLEKLGPQQYPDFSCAEEASRLHHSYLAGVCLRYLLFWPNREIAPQDVASESILTADFEKSPFLWYAVWNWPAHTKSAGHSIKRYMHLVDQFLNLPSEKLGFKYLSMMLYRELSSESERESSWELESWKPDPPEIFLAAQDMREVLENYIFPRQTSPLRRLPGRLLTIFNRPGAQRVLKSRFNKLNKFSLAVADSDQDTMLHIACQYGAFETAKYLLSCGAIGQAGNNHDATPFFLAVNEGDERIAQLLIDRGEAYCSRKPTSNITALHMACFHGMFDIAVYLIANGLDPNASTDEGFTPVHIVAQMGYFTLFLLLILADGNLTATKSGGFTPLHFAAQNGHLQIVKAILEDDNNIDPSPTNEDGWTPLSLAARNGQVDVFDFLRPKVLDIPRTADGWELIHAAAYSGNMEMLNRIITSCDISSKTLSGRHPIHVAASHGHANIVSAFLDLGVDVDVGCRDLGEIGHSENPHMITSLYLAVTEGHKSIVNLLLEKGADRYVVDHRNRNLLHIAASSSHEDIFELLIKQNLPLQKSDDTGMTPFMTAAASGSQKIVEFFLNAEDIPQWIDHPDHNGYTPLFHAIEDFKTPSVPLALINAGADVNIISTNFKDSACHLAATENDDIQIMEALHGQGAVLDLQNQLGHTPLHWAAHKGNVQIIRYLLEHGVNVNTRDELGETPLLIASSRFKTEAVETLLSLGEANPTLTDHFDMSPLDYCWNFKALRDLFQERYPNLKVSTPEQRQVGSEKRLRHFLSQDLDAKLPGDMRNTMASMGNCYSSLQRFDEARICFEKCIVKIWNGKPWFPGFTCDVCLKSLRGPTYFCDSCLDTNICCECFPDRSDHKQPLGCSMDHKYFEMGGKAWEAFPEGNVNDEKTFKQWIQEERVKWGVADPEQGQQS